jgi:hypothetical protein
MIILTISLMKKHFLASYQRKIFQLFGIGMNRALLYTLLFNRL